MAEDHKKNQYILHRAIRGYMLPTLLSTVSMSLAGMVDAIVMGQTLGNLGLATACIALPITFILNALRGLFGSGGATRFAIVSSRGDKPLANRIYTGSLLALCVMSLPLMLLGVWGMRPLAVMLGARDQLIDSVCLYGRVLLLGSPVILLANTMSEFAKADSGPKVAMTGVLLMNGLNLILDYVFIKQLNMGVAGAAYATIAGAAVATLYLFLTAKQRTARLRFDKLNLRIILDVAATGAGVAVMSFSVILVQAFCNHVLVGLGGPDYVAVNAAVNNMLMLFSTVLLGISQGMLTIMATYYGEGNFRQLRVSFLLVLRYTLLSAAFLALSSAILAPSVARLFGLSQDLFPLAVYALRMNGIATLFSGVGILFAMYYQSIEKGGLGALVALCRSLLFLIPCVLLFSRLWGFHGYWIGRATAEFLVLCLCLFLGLHLAKDGKQKFLLVPVGLENVREFATSMKNNISALPRLQDDIQAFCQAHHMPERQAHFTHVLVEELVGNICQHGFRDPGEHYIDILLRLQEGLSVIRIRDDGLPFNPLEFVSPDTSGKTKALGLTLVKGGSKELHYDRIMGFNNLIIKIDSAKLAQDAP